MRSLFARAIPVALLLIAAGRGQVFERPYDDSDPEMAALLDSYFSVVPCTWPVDAPGDPPKSITICPQALDLLRGGSDRLARFLIRQYENPEPEPPFSRWTYLRLLGNTESRTAFDYLARLFETADDADTRLFAMEGLGRTRDLRVIPIALEALDRVDESYEVKLRAVNAVDRVQSKHGPRSEAEAGLRAVLQAREARPAEAAVPPPDHDALNHSIETVLAKPGQTGPGP